MHACMHAHVCVFFFHFLLLLYVCRYLNNNDISEMHFGALL